MILRVEAFEVRGPSSLFVTFNDGTSKVVDLAPLLRGPVFEPLHDPGLFALAALDPDFGVVCWPNGADLAPEAIQALADVRADAPAALPATE